MEDVVILYKTMNYAIYMKIKRKKEKSGFLYFEKDIKDKCDNVKIKKTNASMSHFKQMGDRGRNKASKSTYHDFKNEDDPILMIIKHEKILYY